MNNQIPFGYNPMNTQTFPGINDFNQPIDNQLNNIDYRLKALENKVKKIEEKLNMSYNPDNFNPYQSSMHMM